MMSTISGASRFSAGMALVLLVILIVPVMAAETTAVQRTIAPASPQPAEIMNITITVPPGFFGGIVETLPDGFSFEGTPHPPDGVKQSGRTVIFAVTGEESVSYAIRAPASGCGVISGKWENVGTGGKGEISQEVIAVAGSDPSRCRTVPHTPGFSWWIALAAFGFIGMVVQRQVNR